MGSNMSEKIIGYVRVSTSQQTEGYGIPIQKDSIQKYCQAHQLELVHIYTDEGISSYKDRPEFKKTMEKVLNDSSISGVIVSDLTRFGRSTSELLTETGKIIQTNKKFISVKETLDFSTKVGRMLFGILSVIAEFERETIVERMQAGREWAKVHGTKSGKPMCHPEKPIDWNNVKYLRGVGCSWSKIAIQEGVTATTLTHRAEKEGMWKVKRQLK